MSRSKPPSSLVKSLLVGAIIIGAAMTGVYVGTATRSVVDEPDLSEIFPDLTLKIGTDFPDVMLVGDDNVAVTTGDLIGADGAIVLFIDLGCPPCEQLTKKFQALVAAGEIPAENIIGICPTTPVDYLSGFYTTYGLTFPVYADTTSEFRYRHGVEGYPIMIAVGGDGIIRAVAGDCRMPIEPDQVHAWLGH